MNPSALIIFVRNPLLGKVKTRLAREIGAERALKIYELLLDHTRFITASMPVDKYVFYEDFVNGDDNWPAAIYQKKLQVGDSLGMRMEQAFAELFAFGHERVLIIGSDCLELTMEAIVAAFASLEKQQAVIGPALDGGYYLLGLSYPLPSIFRDKSWSTNTVLLETMADFQKLKIDLRVLPVLSDIDTVSDLPLEFKSW